MAVVYLVGCGEGPGGDGDTRGIAPPLEDAEDGPIALEYVCGNRFFITNSYSVPVSLLYRVVGSTEEGAADLPSAPVDEPAMSERMIETRTRGALQLFMNGKLIAVRENGAIPCSPVPANADFASGDPSSAGEWTAPFFWPIVSVHLSLLPNGKVLAFGHHGSPQVWDPSSGDFTAVPAPALLFCAGHTFAPDGRLIVAGGHISNAHGIPDITIFGTGAPSWTTSTPMQLGRWYPTNTPMGNGEIVITAGKDQNGKQVKIPEVWSPSGLRQLTTASMALPYYPRAFQAPDGKMFVAGPNQATKWLDISGTGRWTNGPKRLFGSREYGAAVMYDEGKILYVGGGHTTNTAEIINLRDGSPQWAWTGSMAFPRRHGNAVILPTGQVLAVGGVSGSASNDLSTAVHPAEMWNPATGVWTMLAGNTTNRGYHTTAILLPDGRVLLSGSGDGAGAPNEKNSEIFSPPYLFQGPRPNIGSVPSSIGYGSSFDVQTSDAGSIARVSLIRIGSTTHAFDMNQRFQKLSFSKGGSEVHVSAPDDPNIAPPGHYLVFLVDDNGVPSIGKIVELN
jgi:hypothetical protein